jgi:hypothetical protein
MVTVRNRLAQYSNRQLNPKVIDSARESELGTKEADVAEQALSTDGPRRLMRGRRPLQRLMLAVGLAAVMVGGLEAVPTQARADDCGTGWSPLTGEHLTSNHLLGVYLQFQNCGVYGQNVKVVVHNYSDNGVGSRAYGLADCSGGGDFDTHFARTNTIFTGVYIPAHGVWSSDGVNRANGAYSAGLIYRPRNTPDEPFVYEVATGCA